MAEKKIVDDIMEKIALIDKGILSVNDDIILTEEVNELVKDNMKNRKNNLEKVRVNIIKQRINSMDNVINSKMTEMLGQAQCNTNYSLTKFGLVKRVIRKLIKCYTRQQVQFNNNVIYLARLFLDKINILSDITQENKEELKNVWDDLARKNEELKNIWENCSRIREELFYEINEKKCKKANKSDIVYIKDSFYKKNESNNGKIKINIGSGPYDVDGYVSVDVRDLKNVDVVADVHKLPFEEESIDEIYSAHMLEHFSNAELEKTLLPYWKTLLKKGGRFIAIVPNGSAMVRQYAEGKIDFKTFSYLIMGGQDYEKNYHYAIFSPESMIEILNNAGFEKVEVIEKERKNHICTEMEIHAYK